MPDLRFRIARRVQKCPICGSHVPEGALVCEICGTDLNTASVLLSSTVKPLSTAGRRGRTAWRLLKVLVGAVAALAVLVWLGRVPVVAARVPMAKSLSQRIEGTVTSAWRWGRQQVAAITMPKRQKPATVQPKPAPEPATPKPAPRFLVRQPDLVPQPGTKPAPVPTAPPTTASPKPVGSPPASQFSLAVRTNPPGAQVHLNATKVGTTPVTIKNVKPGTYTLKITRTGYVPVSQTVKVGDKPLTLNVTLKAAVRAAASPPTAAQTGIGRLLAIGEKAPQFTLKDRMGVIHSLEAARGRKTIVLFVWDIDNPEVRTAIKSLDARSKASPGSAVMVVVLRPDRTDIRNLVSAAQLRVPVLFGTADLARAYGIPANSMVMYMISERGVVERRQVTLTKSSGARR